MVRPTRSWWAALLAAALVSSACGSTLSDEELAAQATESFRASLRQVDPGPRTVPGDGGDSGGAAADPGQPQDAGAAETVGAAPLTGSAGSPGSAPAAGRSPVPGGGAGRGTGTGQGSGGAAAGAGRADAPRSAPTSATAPPAAPAGPRSEIVLGVFGIQSGVIGGVMLPTVHGARAWAADVNARGGVAGHPVRLIVADDEGDPNKTVAIVRRMLDQDKVVAFYAEHAPTTMQAALPIIAERQVPIIGGCACSKYTANHPIAFQVGTGSDWGLVWSHMLQLQAFAPDKKKLSVLSCREVQVCENIRGKFKEAAATLGLKVVHEAQVTLAQPDYTAEVLGARNAGAEALVAVVDNFSAIRMARAAHRQSYFPELVVQFSAHDERVPKVGGEDVEGALIGGGMPSWDSPRLADYRTAMARFVPGGIKATIGINAWVAGKLIERIAGSFPATVTSADILRGLRSLNGETLGGLIPPLTYKENRGTENECIIAYRIEQGRFVPANGDNWVCPPVPKAG
ncbi:MAG: ABC transporter substrate-binding protein [Actinomycetota bacterium]|jgi:branched-chain amino acid transport system substrate-binding protein